MHGREINHVLVATLAFHFYPLQTSHTHSAPIKSHFCAAAKSSLRDHNFNKLSRGKCLLLPPVPRAPEGESRDRVVRARSFRATLARFSEIASLDATSYESNHELPKVSVAASCKKRTRLHVLYALVNYFAKIMRELVTVHRGNLVERRALFYARRNLIARSRARVKLTLCRRGDGIIATRRRDPIAPRVEFAVTTLPPPLSHPFHRENRFCYLGEVARIIGWLDLHISANFILIS